jgi:hypothetical protein
MRLLYPIYAYKSSVCRLLYPVHVYKNMDSFPVVSLKKKKSCCVAKKKRASIYIYLRLFSSCMASKYIYMLFSFFFATQQLFSFFPPVGTSSSPSDLQSKARQSKDLQSKARPTFHHTPLRPAGL